MEYLEAHVQACAASLRKPLVISEFGFAVAKGHDVGRRLQYLTLVRRIWKLSLPRIETRPLESIPIACMCSTAQMPTPFSHMISVARY